VRNKIIISLVTVLFLLFLVACQLEKESSNDNDESEEYLNTSSEFPIVEDSITLDFFVGKGPTNQAKMDEVMAFNEYEDMTNININWEEIASDSLEEKRNLAVAGGELPDAFYAAEFPSSDLLKYGEQGTFIPLNDLIKEHAPNLSKIMDGYDLENVMQSADGNIYAVPRIMDPDFISILVNPLLYYDQEWLDKAEMDVPETTDDLYEFLKFVKESSDDDIIPFGSTDIDGLLAWLKGTFEVGNRGSHQAYIDSDPETGDVRFFPVSDEYKELLKYLNKLYSEDLIASNIFSIEWNQFISNASAGEYASTVFYSPDELFGEIGNHFTSGLPLTGSAEEQQHYSRAHNLYSFGTFVITSDNEYPEATMRWIDYFYSDEGSKLLYMGVEGESYEETEDGYEFLDHITNDPDGLTKEQMLAKYVGYLNTGQAAGIVKEDYFEGSETSDMSLEAVKKLEPYIIDDIWPELQYTKEEHKKMESLSQDIEKYADEMKDKFISGEASFDEWDDYVKTIEKMGLDDYLEIETQAIERLEE